MEGRDGGGAFFGKSGLFFLALFCYIVLFVYIDAIVWLS